MRMLGPPEDPVPGEAARDAFAERFVQSLIDGSPSDAAKLFAPGDCPEVSYEVLARGSYSEDEDGAGTRHEYIVRLERISHRTIWVHQVDGRVVGAGLEPPRCAPIP